MVSVIALLSVLAWAVIRPRGWPEAIAAVPAAVILIAAGVIPASEAGAEARRLGPVIGFLIAILVLAHLCADDGLFQACLDGAVRRRRPAEDGGGAQAAGPGVRDRGADHGRAQPGRHGGPAHPGGVRHRARLEVQARPHVCACTHLANSGSVLLPVSNLTNLLAFSASGLAFGRFTALMALPWLAVIGIEYVVFSRFFASDLSAGPRSGAATQGARPDLPVFTLTVVALTLAGFVAASAAGVSPAWAALAGAAVLAVRALRRKRTSLPGLLRAAELLEAAARRARTALRACGASRSARTDRGGCLGRCGPADHGATATGPGSGRRAWARLSGSWWTTPPARSCWSGRSRRPTLAPFPRRRLTLTSRAGDRQSQAVSWRRGRPRGGGGRS